MLQKILHESRIIPDTHNLENLLFLKLRERIQRRNRITLGSYALASVFSGIFLYIYVGYLMIDFRNSNLFTYLHVLFEEDLNTLTHLSKEILYTLFESLPMMSLTLTLGLVCMVMISVNGIMSSLQKGFLYKK